MKLGLVAACALLLLLSACSLPPSLPVPTKPYSSDGCSLWPDLDYTECCEQHDRSYWQGGTAHERKLADQKLRQCVSQKNRPVNAFFMYAGVRVGGHGWLPTPFRWGFGHPWPQGYSREPKKLNP